MKFTEAAFLSRVAEVAYAGKPNTASLTQRVADMGARLLTAADFGIPINILPNGYYQATYPQTVVDINTVAAYAAVKSGQLLIGIRGSDEGLPDYIDGYFAREQAGHFAVLRPFLLACSAYAVAHGLEIVVAGHSLGGAMATQFAQSDIAATLAGKGVELSIFTLASPGSTLAKTLPGIDAVHLGIEQDIVFGRNPVPFTSLFYPGKFVSIQSAASQLGTSTQVAADFANVKRLHSDESFTVMSRFVTALAALPADALFWANQDIENVQLYSSPDSIKPGSGAWTIGAPTAAKAGMFLGSRYVDDFTAGARGDLLMGLGGNDTLRGGVGRDYLIGGDGNDQLFAGEGAYNWLYGDAGNDVLTGGSGGDRLYGGAGADRIDTGPSTQTTDYVWGGDGNDTITAGAGAFGQRQIYGEGGADIIRGADGRDFIWGDADADRLWGNGSNDTLRGGDGDDIVYGGAENDLVYGEAGNDVLSGDAGDDQLYGAEGSDRLTGGAGKDYLDGGAGVDTYFAKDGVQDKIVREYYMSGASKVFVDIIGSADAIDIFQDVKIDRPPFL